MAVGAIFFPPVRLHRSSSGGGLTSLATVLTALCRNEQARLGGTAISDRLLAPCAEVTGDDSHVERPARSEVQSDAPLSRVAAMSP